MCKPDDVQSKTNNRDNRKEEEEERKDPSQWFTMLIQEMLTQLETALPTIAGMLFYKIPWLVSLRFVGGIGADELAAAALASTIFNVTGMSISVGLSSAITTLTAQARGSLLKQKPASLSNSFTEEESILLSNQRSKIENYSSTPTFGKNEIELKSSAHQKTTEPLLPLVYLYRGLFVQFLFVVPMGLWWIKGVKPLLIALGQPSEVSSMTEKYLRILTPGLWSYSINWTLSSWLQALEMADVPAYAAAAGAAMHIPFNHLFVYTMKWGYLGCAVATVTFQSIQPIITLCYILLTKKGYKRLLENTAAPALGLNTLSFWKEAKEAIFSLTGLLQYLALAIPGILIISEWWASEASIFLAGRLTPSPELALGSMSLYQSMDAFCYMLSVGFSVAASTRVGNLLGAGKHMSAKFAGSVSILLAGAVSGLMTLILFFTPFGFFPSLFAPGEDELVHETSKLIPLLAMYVFSDGIVCALHGIVKGCGRQAIITPIVVICYWVVAIPLSYYMAFVRHDGQMCSDGYFCGTVGLVAGMTLGTWCHAAFIGIMVVCSTDWKKEARKAKARLYAEIKNNGLSGERKFVNDDQF